MDMGLLCEAETPWRGATNDRISHLPKSILAHILSLLPTKEAVATSLISKRWKFLWTHIHTLNLYDLQPSGEALLPVDLSPTFVKFVNRVLLILHGKSIDKFYFETNKPFREDKVYDDFTFWISIAVARNIKALEFVSMNLIGYLPMNFPSSFFNCKTLHSLRLHGVKVQTVPSFLHLPNLKTIRLKWVYFDETLGNFISACSSLETLYIERDTYDDKATFTVSSPTLLNLSIVYVEGDSGYADNLAFSSKLIINAPSLSYLHLSDYLTTEISFENLCSLEEADIETWFSVREESYVDSPYDTRYERFVAELVRVVCNVKYLFLDGDIFKVLSDTELFPCFPRLTRLDLVARYCGWNSLLDLIKGMNQLQWLAVENDQVFGSGNVTSWRKPEEVPVCLSSCLEEIFIDEFEGLEYELGIVEYILENAQVLRTMTIKGLDKLRLQDRFQLLQKLAMFPRTSKACTISFY